MITAINTKNGQLWKSWKFKGSKICNDNSNQYQKRSIQKDCNKRTENSRLFHNFVPPLKNESTIT